MSAEEWLRAVKTEEQRLLDEMSKTILYKQLEAVRTVIAVYEGPAESRDILEHPGAPRTNGQHSFKKANAFSASDAAGDATSHQGRNSR
jgi:hypothetical protein